MSRSRALVLSRDHRCLLIGGAPPEVSAAGRTLPALTELLGRLGLEASTCGSTAAGDFAFIAREASEIERGRWTPIGELAGDPWGWQAYVEMMLGGWEPPRPPDSVFAFGSGPEMESRLAHLVTCGAKRATATWVRALELEGESAPEVGWISIVVDGFGAPRCAIRTESVERVRFAKVTAEMAALEGEGDRTLDHWRRGHAGFFEAEARSLGLEFGGDDEPILFERFAVIAVIGRADQ